MVSTTRTSLFNRAEETVGPTPSIVPTLSPTPAIALRAKPGEFIIKLDTPLKTNNYKRLKNGSMDASQESDRLAPLVNAFNQLNLASFNALTLPPSVHKNIYLLKFPDKTKINTILETISPLDEVAYIEPNYIYTIQSINDPLYTDNPPNYSEHRDYRWDPTYSYQWNLRKIHLEEALAYEASPKSKIKVGLIDTGVANWSYNLNSGFVKECGAVNVDPHFPSEKACTNFISIDDRDDNGHGTHVAGIMAATQNNDFGMSGMSNNIVVHSSKALDKNGIGTVGSITAAIYSLTDPDKGNAKIVNMSFGAPVESLAITEALSDAYFINDVVLVASSGNTGSSSPSYPAATVCENPNNRAEKEPCVIAVGSSDVNDRRSLFSSWGQHLNLVAPGGGDDKGENYNIISLNAGIIYPNKIPYKYKVDYVPSDLGLFLRLGGTSMAAPHVSALAGMIRNKLPNIKAGQVRSVLENSADDVGLPGWDPYTGFGRINALSALSKPDPSKPIKAYISYPASGTRLNKAITVSGTADGDKFLSYTLEHRQTDTQAWSADNVTYPNNDNTKPIISSTLGMMNLDMYQTGEVQLKLTVKTSTTTKESVVTFILDNRVKKGWPYQIKDTFNKDFPMIPVIADINTDHKKEVIVAGPQTVSVVNYQANPYVNWDSRSFNLDAIFAPGYPTMHAVPTVDDIDLGDCHHDCDKEIFFVYDEPTLNSLIDMDWFESIVGYTLSGKQILYDQYLWPKQFFGDDYLTTFNLPMSTGEVYNDNQNKLVVLGDDYINTPDGGRKKTKLAFVYNNLSSHKEVKTGELSFEDLDQSTQRQEGNLMIGPFTSDKTTTAVFAQDSLSSYFSKKGKVTKNGSSPHVLNNSYFMADTDNDGVDELVTTAEDKKDNIYIISINNSGSTRTIYSRLAKRVNDDSIIITPSDFNGDTKMDYLLYTYDEYDFGRMDFIDNNGSLLFTAQDPYSQPSNYSEEDHDPSNILLGDIDNDGYKEMVKIDVDENKEAVIHFHRVKADKLETDVYPSIPLTDNIDQRGPINSYMALDDIDADGSTDLVVVAPQYGKTDNIWNYFIYAYDLGTEIGEISWGQYNANSRHTRNYSPDPNYWRTTVDLVCKNGQKPGGEMSDLSFEYLVWPAKGLQSHVKSISSLPYSMGISSGELPTSIYIRVKKGEQYLLPTGTPPDPHINYGTAFKQKRPAIFFRNEDTPHKPYTFDFLALDSMCQ